MLTVEEILLKGGIEIDREDGNDFVIHCLNPDHADSNPSLRVDRDSGLFHCFACGFGGNRNTLLKNLGIELTPQDFDELRIADLRNRAALSRYFEDLVQPKTIERLPGAAITEPFRGVAPEILAKIGIIRNRRMGRILIPIEIGGHLRGYTMRALFGQKPKYIHSSDVKFSELLFPYDFIERQGIHKPIFLVEGPFDALGLINIGHLALCIFGVDSWSDKKLELLINLQPSKVIILFDNDEAGFDGRIKLAKVTAKLFKTYIASSGSMQYSGYTDPGEITPDILSKLKFVQFTDRYYGRIVHG
jgi:DNA primase